MSNLIYNKAMAQLDATFGDIRSEVALSTYEVAWHAANAPVEVPRVYASSEDLIRTIGCMAVAQELGIAP